MTRSTLIGLAFIGLLGFTACQPENPETVSAAPPDIAAWRLASGKTPSQAEFAAITATCEDKSKGGAFDDCLANLGLKHSQ